MDARLSLARAELGRVDASVREVERLANAFRGGSERVREERNAIPEHWDETSQLPLNW